uniref:Uncharacterized protein n=1 Tax=Molossus molossus TaxID=27622 RepID=A0A7J8EEL5_MOLMO|nr:hypothetical protein HJG59_008895 [Molossus molossus]
MASLLEVLFFFFGNEPKHFLSTLPVQAVVLFLKNIFHYISLHIKAMKKFEENHQCRHVPFLFHSKPFCICKHIYFSHCLVFYHGCLSFSQNLSENICPAIEFQCCSLLASRLRESHILSTLKFSIFPTAEK